MNVVTYDELFQLMLVLISFAGLIITITKKEVTAPSLNVAVTSCNTSRG